jgi:hypothetical protein
MSSPIYPGFIEDLSPEDLQSLSEIDYAASQGDCFVAPIQLPGPTKFHAGGLKPSQLTGDKRRASHLGLGGNNNPVTIHTMSTSVQPTSNGGIQPGPSVPAAVGFASVRAMAGNIGTKGDYPSPGLEGEPPEQDYDPWFGTPSTDVPAFVGFQSGTIANDTGFVGFTSVGKGTTFMPSESAIQKVKKRMRDWEADFEEEISYMQPSTSQSKVTPPQPPATPPRPSLDSDEIPKSPTPASPRPVSPHNTTFGRSAKQKPFKPPLLSNKTNLTNSVPASPSNATKSKGSVPSFKPPLLSSPSASTLPKPSTPSRASSDSSFRTPVRLGGVQRPGSVKKFTTPFKPGMRPGELGREKLQEDQERKRLQERPTDQVIQIQMHSPPRKPAYDIPSSLKSPSGSRKGKEKAKEYRVFDLSQCNLGSLIAAFD